MPIKLFRVENNKTKKARQKSKTDMFNARILCIDLLFLFVLLFLPPKNMLNAYKKEYKGEIKMYIHTNDEM